MEPKKSKKLLKRTLITLLAVIALYLTHRLILAADNAGYIQNIRSSVIQKIVSLDIFLFAWFMVLMISLSGIAVWAFAHFIFSKRSSGESAGRHIPIGKKIDDLTRKLAAANKEIHAFSIEMDGRVKESTMELATLYEISNAISYAINKRDILTKIMESMHNVFNYDVCNIVFFERDAIYSIVELARGVKEDFAEDTLESIIKTLSKLTGKNLNKEHVSEVKINFTKRQKNRESYKPDILRSSINMPLHLNGKPSGMINISSCDADAFDENAVKFIYTVSNQIAGVLEKLEAATAVEKNKIDNMVKSMTEGVIMTDVNDDIFIFNPKAKELLGFRKRDEVISRNDFYNKVNELNLGATLENSRKNNEPLSQEISVTIEGHPNILSVNISPVKNFDNERIGMVFVLRNITKEKEIANMKTEFISTVSHELRTPLATMKEFVAIIADEIPGKLNAGQKEYLGIIKGNIDRLARLINDLLDISKIEAGKVTLKRTFTDIYDLMDNVILSLKPNYESKGIKINKKFALSRTKVYIDYDRIVQVMVNLISNAIKFTPENGKIDLFLEETDKNIKCSVKDNGMGVPKADIDKVFDQFKQVDRETGSGTKGTGLGLAITRKIVQMHKGDIWAESEREKGSEFIFTLPKYSVDLIIREYVDAALHNAAKNGVPMSLDVISIKDYKKFSENTDENKRHIILSDLKSVVGNILRSEEDLFFACEDKMMIILPECDKDNAANVSKRIRESMERYIDEQKLTEVLNLAIREASYPADGATVSELLDKVLR